MRQERVLQKSIFMMIVLMALISWLTLNLTQHKRLINTDNMLDVSVSIKTISHVRIDKYGDSVWEPTYGSGFLVDAHTCEVWTNHHVIANAAIIEVIPRGSRPTEGIPTTLVNSTPRTDLAVLRMSHCENIPAAKLGNSDQVRPGDETYAVGNPLGSNPDSISRGIISHTHRFDLGPIPYLQTDAAINRGNSGGALFNGNGEVIGMNTALASPDGKVNSGIGYAMPINSVRSIALQLRKGPLSWGDAGLSEHINSLTPQEAAIFRVPAEGGAIIVTSKPETGPSADIIQSRDVIYEIAGTSIQDAAHANRLISARASGERVQLKIIRKGELMSVDIVLRDGRTETAQHQFDDYDGYLGLTLEMWVGNKDTDKQSTASELVDVSNETKGKSGKRGAEKKFDHPVITKVHSLGPAHRAQITSSQSGVALRGPYAVPYQINVKSVTGVVYDGTYHAVSSIETLEKYARQAFERNQPMLLEIEYWARENPKNIKAELERQGTAFFRIDPARSNVADPPGAQMEAARLEQFDHHPVLASTMSEIK